MARTSDARRHHWHLHIQCGFAAAALSLGTIFPPRQLPRRWWLLGMACAVVPDVDVIGLRFGAQYGDLLGHRGITHSFAFAVALSLPVALCATPPKSMGANRAMLVLYLFIATASHGVLDAMTNGGLGIAFFAPFSSARYFFHSAPSKCRPSVLKRSSHSAALRC